MDVLVQDCSISIANALDTMQVIDIFNRNYVK